MKKFWILGLEKNKKSLESIGIKLSKYDKFSNTWTDVELNNEQIKYLDQVNRC